MPPTVRCTRHGSRPPPDSVTVTSRCADAGAAGGSAAAAAANHAAASDATARARMAVAAAAVAGVLAATSQQSFDALSRVEVHEERHIWFDASGGHLVQGFDGLHAEAPAASLVRDGTIVAGAQEERFSRKKHDARFPAHAISSCLEQAGIGVNDLDQVVFYDKPLVKFERFELAELVRLERQGGRCDILFQVAPMLGAGDRHNVQSLPEDPGQSDFGGADATLALAIDDLVKSFGPRYPKGPEYLKRLEGLEHKQKEQQDAASRRAHRAPAHAAPSRPPPARSTRRPRRGPKPGSGLQAPPPGGGRAGVFRGFEAAPPAAPGDRAWSRCRRRHPPAH